jgi:hypothetical protein
MRSLVSLPGGQGVLCKRLIAGDPPPLYLSILDQMDPSSTGSVSLAAVHRTLSTSKLPAATIEKVSPYLATLRLKGSHS